MKILKVPYAEKDEAKALGARWNSARKAWYVPDGKDEAPFAKWLSAGGDSASASGAATSASKDSFSGAPVTGKHFIENAHDCDPFTVCASCAPKLAEAGWTDANNAVRQMLGTLGR